MITRAGLGAAIVWSTLLLTACAGSGPPRPSDRQIDRMLQTAPGEAQPSKVVAAEIELAQAMRGTSMVEALRGRAAPGAILHDETGARGFSGSVPFERPASWRPRAVWTSCDGAMAVSEGRYRDIDGKVGDFVTIWQRQRDGIYRWSYRTQALSIPQPPPRPDDTPAGVDEIVVSALDTIKGIVADCPDAEQVVTTAPVVAIAPGQAQGRLVSADGTLRVVWTGRTDGTRSVVADHFTYSGWERGLDRSFSVAPAPRRE